jgi:hypothetical protein
MQGGSARGYDDPIQFLVLNGVLDIDLPIFRTGVPVFGDELYTRCLSYTLQQGFYVDSAGDILAAVTDEDSDSFIFTVRRHGISQLLSIEALEAFALYVPADISG